MTACWRGWPDAGRQRHSGGSGSCATNSGCPPWGRSRCPDSPAGHGDVWNPLVKCEQEAEDRRQRRIGRLRTASRLPAGKTWETFEHDRVPLALRSNWASWPAAASSTAASTCWPSDCPAPARPMHCAPWATGWWSRDARSSSSRPTGWCRTCGGQADLALPRQLRKLDNYDFLLLDDLGYAAPRGRRVRGLFTLIAERYERRSLGITSNLVFSQWEHIFANPMATAAAIDWSTTRSSWNSTSPATRSGPAAQSETGGEPA